ncbi:MAG: hypothetical protein U0900_14785 [Myxococcota bacterium]
MSFSKPLTEREKALEEAFFREQNAKLIESLRAKKAQSEQQEALSRVLGVRDQAVLAPLIGLGVRAESVTALVLAPLVAVAWADRQLDDEERRAILAAEEHYGIDPQSEAGKLLATWLQARPHESLIEVWSAYVKGLLKSLAPAERARLRTEILERSSRIASAFEKTFLRGGAPNRAEAGVLAKIEAAFAEAEA